MNKVWNSEGRMLENSAKKRWIRTAGILGVLTPIVAFTCIIASTQLASSFSWTDNALSDLGVMPGTTALLFNTGLIVGGALAAIFAIGLYLTFERSILGKIGAIILLLSTLALISIGIFTERFKPTHLYVSVAFFALFPISMLILSTSFFMSNDRKRAMFTLAVALFAAAVWALEFTIKYVPGVAIPETLSALGASCWTIVLGFNMIDNRRHRENSPT
jgi:hypothetical membrane protein